MRTQTIDDVDDVAMKWITSMAIVLLNIIPSKQQRVVSAFIATGIINRSISTRKRSSYPTFKLKYDETNNNNNNNMMMRMSSTQISHASKNTSLSSLTTGEAVAIAPTRCQYVVSRNGIVLPWQQVHQQYRRVGQDDNHYYCDASSNQRQSNDNDNNNNIPLDSNTLLQLLPRGAYTTCRTVKGGSHIYQFDYHVRRLANSAKSILMEVQLQSASSSSSSSVVGNGDGSDDSSVEVEERLGDTNQDQATTTSISGVTTSNHPIQHDRQLSSFEINTLNITNVVWEHDMALKCIRNTLREFCTCYGVCLRDYDDGDEGNDDIADEKVEFKITLLATWEKKRKRPFNDVKSHAAYESALYCHVGLLKPKNVSTAATTTAQTPQLTRVLIHGHGRENALAKDSKWVLDREKLTKPSTLDDNRNEEGDNVEGNTNEENLQQQPFEEIILINDEGELLEGTQTNFYVVSGGGSQQQQQPCHSIITANEGILYGSVRDSVLRACRHHNIQVELRPPTLKDLKSASGVFISSTSRWVMPIHEVCLGDLLSFQNDDDIGEEEEEEEEEEEGSGSIDKTKRNGKSYFYGACKITEDIRRWVLEDVESRSTPLF